jgi:hypothetical protein
LFSSFSPVFSFQAMDVLNNYFAFFLFFSCLKRKNGKGKTKERENQSTTGQHGIAEYQQSTSRPPAEHIRDHRPTRAGTAQQGTAGHSRAQQGTAGHSRAQQGTAGHSRAQQGTARPAMSKIQAKTTSSYQQKLHKPKKKMG